MDDMDDEGFVADTSEGQRAGVTPHTKLTLPMADKGEVSSGTDLSYSSTSDSSDNLAEISTAGRKSPSTYGIPGMKMRMGRSPGRRLEHDDLFVHPVSQGYVSNLSGRRRSDPGRVSVSPLRSRVRVDSDIAEDDVYDEQITVYRQSFNKLAPGHDTECVAGKSTSLSPIRSRSRSPHLQGRVKAMRSHSLPCSDPSMMDIGEAFGAIALNRPEVFVPEIIPENPGSALVANRRRRSVSVESTSPLEAIMEENERQRNSRRFSTPAMAANERVA